MQMNNYIPLPHPSFLEKLNLNLTFSELKAKYPRSHRHHYLAIINWFSRPVSAVSQPSLRNKIEILKGYLQSFYHLIEIADWEKASLILIEDLTTDVTLEAKDFLGQIHVWGYYQTVLDLTTLIYEQLPPNEQLIIINRISNAYDALAQYERAKIACKSAIKLATELGQLKLSAKFLSNLAGIHLSTRDYDSAIKYYQAASELAKEINDDRLESALLINQGYLYISIGDYVNALEWLEKAKTLAQKTGNRYAESLALTNIGIAHGKLGKYQKSEAYSLQALAMSQDFGDRQGELSVFINLGNNCSDAKDYHKAIKYHQKALEIAQELNVEIEKYNSLIGLGNAYYFLEDYQQAQTYFESSQQIAKQMEYPLGLAIAKGNIGSNLSKSEQFEAAIPYLTEAFTELKELKALDLCGVTAYRLAETYHHLQQNNLATAYLEFATSMAKDLALPLLNECTALKTKIDSSGQQN